MRMKKKIGFIGAGKVGSAMSTGLSKKGFEVVALYDVNPEAVKKLADKIKGCKIVETAQKVVDAADAVFITTIDSMIEPIASSVKWRAGQYAIHVSGGCTVDLLNKAKKDGAFTGVMHPGQIFFSAENGYESIVGSTFDIEAEEPSLSMLGDLANALDAYWVKVASEDKAAYHVTIEFSTLYVMLMARISTNIMAEMGISAEAASKIISVGVATIAKTIRKEGVNRPLVGPVDRCDIKTIENHIDTMKRVFPSAIPLYKEFVRQNIILAEGNTINTKDADTLKATIDY